MCGNRGTTFNLLGRFTQDPKCNVGTNIRLCVAHGKGKYWPFTSEKNAFRKHVSRLYAVFVIRIRVGSG